MSCITWLVSPGLCHSSCDTDFLLLTLRRVLLKRREAASSAPLRVCLMSATLDGDTLSSYFSGLLPSVPRVSFPVRDLCSPDRP